MSVKKKTDLIQKEIAGVLGCQGSNQRVQVSNLSSSFLGTFVFQAYC